MKVSVKILLCVLILVCIIVVSVGFLRKSETVNLDNLVKELNNQNYHADFHKQKDGLSGVKKFVNVGKENIVVYHYSDGDSMEKDADKISEDGYTLGNSMVEWDSKPHFYKKDKSIIQYIGTNKRIIKSLTETVGIQFAGQ